MLIALLAVLALLLGLLAIPVGVVYRVSWRGKFQGDIHLYWLFGLLHVRIPTAPTPSSPPHKNAKPKPSRRHKTKAKHKTNPLAAWRIRSFRQRIIKFLRDLWRAIHKRDVRLHLLIGLDDPADTGQLWALMGPLSAVLAQSRAVRIDIEPDFTESHLEFNSSGDIRVIPLQLIGLALALLLSPPFWYGLQQMRKAA
jgi:hypothetical protein